MKDELELDFEDDSPEAASNVVQFKPFDVEFEFDIYRCTECNSSSWKLYADGAIQCAECDVWVENVRCFDVDAE